MNINGKTAIELLNWLTEEIESKKYNRRKASTLLKMAIKHNSKGGIDPEYYYIYDEKNNTYNICNR